MDSMVNKNFKIRIVLCLICFFNLFFIFLRNDFNLLLFTILIQLILAVFLIMGSNIVRIYYIASVVEDFLYLLKFQYGSTSLGVFNVFIIDENRLLQALIMFDVVVFCVLVFSKNVNTYFLESNFVNIAKLKSVFKYSINKK